MDANGVLTARIPRGMGRSLPIARPVLDRVARAHRQELEAFAVRLAGDRSEGRALVIDALARARRRVDVARASDARAWLFSLLHDAFLARCCGGASRHEGTTPPAWTALSPAKVRAAVAELEPELRDVFVRHSFDRCSYAEIARALTIPVATVEERLTRARAALRATLEHVASAPEDA
jgi:RNA polymerase sigma-70 factor (ECF subfamily)